MPRCSPFCLDFSEIRTLRTSKVQYRTKEECGRHTCLFAVTCRKSSKLQAAVICLVCFHLPKKKIAHAKQHTTTPIPRRVCVCVCVHLDCKTQQKKERAIKDVMVRWEGMSIECETKTSGQELNKNKWEKGARAGGHRTREVASEGLKSVKLIPQRYLLTGEGMWNGGHCLTDEHRRHSKRQDETCPTGKPTKTQ